MAFTVGDLIDGQYRVEKRYAGGMGFVYVVRDEYVGKRFAIKQLPEFQAENKVLAERFRREASAWLLLDYHPHIVQAHSYHPRPEGPILILEFVDGTSLDRLLKSEKRLSPAQAVSYARQFCQAMSYAHSKPIPDRGIGVLHRDIKPGNILITRGNQLKVTDFGLAKFEEGESKLTGEGQFIGTIAYSSPEQLRSASKVTRASDVYSFGAVLYQMLAGQAAFRAPTAADLYRLIVQTSPLHITDLCSDLDPGLAAVVMRCLEKDAANRYADFMELDRALAGMELAAKDRRDWSCTGCGFTSRSSADKCPICDTAASGAAVASRAPAGSWNCFCGALVPVAEKACPKCGRNQAASKSTVIGGEGPPPASDLVSLPASDEAAPAADALKPSDTAWPGGTPQTPGDSNVAVAPVDSQVVVAGPPSTTRRVWDPANQQPWLVELGTREKLLGWPLERNNYTVGRDSHMRIRLKDPDVAGYQLFLIRLPCGWLAINRQLGVRVEFNGWKSDQRLLAAGDLIHVGSTWLAFFGSSGTNVTQPPIPGRWSEKAAQGQQTVQTGGSAPTHVQGEVPAVCAFECPGGRELTTRGEPLRIGSSPVCDVSLSDRQVAPLQGLVSWQIDGPHISNLTGAPIVLVNGRPVTDSLLSHGDELSFGGVSIRVRIDGDPTAPVRRRAADELANQPRMACTIVGGPQKGQMGVLPNGQAVVLGRHSECDFSIASDPYMSRRHLQLNAASGSVEVRDLGSRHGFAIGQTSYTDKAVLRSGDVLRVGQSFFLFHYELTG